MLRQEKEKLDMLIRRKEKEIECAPEGSVLVKKHKKGVQFFYREDPKDRNGTYMLKEDRKRAIALVQKRYDRKLLAAAMKQKRALDAFLKEYDPDALKKIFEKEGILRQSFLNPAELPDALFIAAWERYEYEPMGFREDVPVHFTQKKERVRSKSEVLIANALYNAKIPYRYECPLNLGDQKVHPDFTILRISDRKEVYYEHFGMMDDMEYRNRAFQKIRAYENNGFIMGDRLICTFETYRMPLHTGIVESIIKQYLA